MQYQFMDIHFPGWEVVRKLGQGSFGGVYEIQRTLPDGRVEKAALKKLSVPRDSGEIEEFRSQSFSTESITEHYKDQMSDLVREYSLMQELSSCKNIVACHDVRYTRQSNGIGWDVYIRMELLQPLKQVLPVAYSETTVLKLGLSLCNALRACQKYNIIHRDIKPENILVSSDGVFKLGDFGIAKISEKTTVGTLTGTAGYMAPEVANRWNYGPASDIYSLGMVLYWAMNERTLPFLPLPPQIPTGLQRQAAIDRRYAGEIFPPPKNGSRELKAIVMKACAFLSEDRYQNAWELQQDLNACCRQRGIEENDAIPNQPDTDEEENVLMKESAADTYTDSGSFHSSSRMEHTGTLKTGNSAALQEEKKSHKWVWIPVCILLLAGGYTLGKQGTAPSTETLKTDSLAVEGTSSMPESGAATASRKTTIEPAPEVVPTTTTEAKTLPEREIPHYRKGESIYLGTYWSDKTGAKKEKIQWDVLDVRDHKVLLLSHYGLDTVQYDGAYGKHDWAGSSIREWLNASFLHEAFTDIERQCIDLTYVDNGVSQGYSQWNTDGGENTNDYVFLLSYAEAKRYFDISEAGTDGPAKARIQPAEYAVGQGAFVSDQFRTVDGEYATRWWLRSPGYNQSDAACVHARGCLGEQGCTVADTCVRPAMWVDLEKLSY